MIVLWTVLPVMSLIILAWWMIDGYTNWRNVKKFDELMEDNVRIQFVEFRKDEYGEDRVRIEFKRYDKQPTILIKLRPKIFFKKFGIKKKNIRKMTLSNYHWLRDTYSDVCVYSDIDRFETTVCEFKLPETDICYTLLNFDEIMKRHGC